MRWLFRENASKREKAYFLFLLLFVAALGYGILNGFAPSETVISLAAYLALPGSLVFFLPLLLDRHPANKIRTYGLAKRLLVYALALPACYIGAWGGIAIGMPAVATRLAGDTFSGEYKVIAKGSGRWSWKYRCSPQAVYLRSLTPPVEVQICPGREFWQQAKVGDVFVLTGHRSSLGVLHEDVKPR